MDIYIYKSDEGCRKGCHPVVKLVAVRKQQIWETQVFSIDEPGAWWDDVWNCHVDGCDYRCASRSEAIEKGIRFYNENNFKVYYE